MRTVPRPTVAEGLLLVATTSMAVLQWIGVEGANWADSDVYRMGGRAVLDGSDLYSARTGNDFPFIYSPFAAVTMVPLAWGPVGLGRLLLTTLSLVAVVTVVYVLSRALRLTRMATVTLALATLAIEPTLRTLLLGQVNFILLAMVVVDLMLLRSGRGLLIGIAAGIKLTPAAFLVVLAVQKDWCSAARAAGAFITTVAVGFAVAPASSAHFWGGGLFEMGEYDELRLGTDNQSLLAAVLRVSHRPDLPAAVEILVLALGMGFATLVALRFRRASSSLAIAAMASAVAFGALLGSPLSWSHHWCSVVVFMAVLQAAGRHALAGLVTAVFWFPVVWLTYTDVPFGELEFSPLQATASIPYVLVGAASLVWLATTPRSDGRGHRSAHAADSPNGLTQFGRAPDPMISEVRQDL